jgi:predicted PurR-regulated permease PerM
MNQLRGGGSNKATVNPRRPTGELVRKVGVTLGAYLKGQLIISSILTVLYAVGFAIAGLPIWFLVAPVCGLLNVIPYFGFLIALGLGALVAFLGGLSYERIIAVVLIFVAVSALESYWLTPRILGRRLGLRPLYVFLAVLVAGTGFGFIGLLLAVPVLAVATVIYRFYNSPQQS